MLSYKENIFLACRTLQTEQRAASLSGYFDREFLTAERAFRYIDKLLNNFALKVLFDQEKNR